MLRGMGATLCLVGIFSLAGFLPAAEPATKAPVLTVVGTDGKPVTFEPKELKTLPRTTVETTDRQGKPTTYSGVAISELLTRTNVPLGPDLRDEWLRVFVLVEAADEYRVTFALPEFDPGFATRVILLADEQDGQQLAESKGLFQIVVPGEKRHARWVRNVLRIRVLDSLDIDRAAETSPPQ